MKKIFLATPMSAFSKEEYQTLREFLLDLKTKNPNIDIFSEITNINDQDSFEDPVSATQKDIDKIKECDLFIMIHPQKIQSSTLFELGIAYSLNKDINIYVKSNKDILPFMITNLDKVHDKTKIYNYKDLNNLNLNF